jgi:cytochrome P450
MTIPRPGIPISTLNFQAPDFARDPYPAFHELRRAGPISYHEGMQRYVIAGWRECSKMLLNSREFGSDEDAFIDLFGGRTMECMERERHTPVRGIWRKDFEHRSLEAWTSLIREVVESRMRPFVERIRAGETVDAVSGMTRGIPTIVIAKMLGIPASDFELFSAWSDAMGDSAEGVADRSPRGQEIVRKGRQATLDLNDYIRARLGGRRACPGDDLISRMVTSPVAETMDEAEIVASNTQLVFAGNETTAKLMAITMAELARHPDQRRALVADRTLLPQALEEIHRCHTIVHVNGRYARGGNATVGGHVLEDGDNILILQGAANRDPERWEDPDRLDIFREPRQHLGFGLGMHVCLGISLARLEAQIWLDALLDELPEWEATNVDWGTNWAVRGPIRLDIQKSQGG